jgi:hypothetical protein
MTPSYSGEFVLAYKGAECTTGTEGETWGNVKSLFRWNA